MNDRIRFYLFGCAHVTENVLALRQLHNNNNNSAACMNFNQAVASIKPHEIYKTKTIYWFAAVFMVDMLIWQSCRCIFLGVLWIWSRFHVFVYHFEMYVRSLSKWRNHIGNRNAPVVTIFRNKLIKGQRDKAREKKNNHKSQRSKRRQDFF